MKRDPYLYWVVGFGDPLFYPGADLLVAPAGQVLEVPLALPEQFAAPLLQQLGRNLLHRRVAIIEDEARVAPAALDGPRPLLIAPAPARRRWGTSPLASHFGERLASDLGMRDVSQLLASCDVVSLLPRPEPLPSRRRLIGAAEALLPALVGREVLMLGRNVAEAFRAVAHDHVGTFRPLGEGGAPFRHAFVDALHHLRGAGVDDRLWPRLRRGEPAAWLEAAVAGVVAHSLAPVGALVRADRRGSSSALQFWTRRWVDGAAVVAGVPWTITTAATGGTPTELHAPDFETAATFIETDAIRRGWRDPAAVWSARAGRVLSQGGAHA